MKKIQIVLTALIVLFAFSAALATTPASINSKVDWQKAEKNYVIALNSENSGVRNSAANLIGEYRLNGAVNDLVFLLQNDRVEKNRMAAALSLVQIGSKEALQAVKDASVYDGSDKVAKYCEQLLGKSANNDDLSLKN